MYYAKVNEWFNGDLFTKYGDVRHIYDMVSDVEYKPEIHRFKVDLPYFEICHLNRDTLKDWLAVLDDVEILAYLEEHIYMFNKNDVDGVYAYLCDSDTHIYKDSMLERVIESIDTYMMVEEVYKCVAADDLFFNKYSKNWFTSCGSHEAICRFDNK